MPCNELRKLSLKDTLFTVIDVETTGLNPVNNRITEIAIVKLKNGNIISEYSRLINPGQFINPEISRLTGITNELVFGKPYFSDIAHEVIKNIQPHDRNILCGHNVRFDYRFLNQSLQRCGYPSLSIPSLCTARIARRLHYDLRSRSLESLKKHYGFSSRRRHRALDDARLTAEILMHLLDRLTDEYEFETVGDIISFQYKRIFNEENTPSKLIKLKTDISNAPSFPGVYFMYDRRGDIIYIGKTKNLRERLSSYLSHNAHLPTKVKKLLRSVSKIKWEVKYSELSALIHESKLIKKHKPRFNSAIKRYRRYPYIKIDINNPYPRIYKVSEILSDNALYFGPFSSTATVEYLINRINKKFHIRKCRDRYLRPSAERTPCIYFEIKQCSAPCNYNVSMNEYRNEVKSVCEYLISDNSSGAIGSLLTEMNNEAESLNFERASILKYIAEDLRKVILNTEITHSLMQLKNFLIKCRNHGNKSFELFLIKHGRIVNTYYIDDRALKDINFINNLAGKINQTFTNGSLFGNYTGELIHKKLTREDIDALKIITNWVYRNYCPSDIFKITQDLNSKDLLSFIMN